MTSDPTNPPSSFDTDPEDFIDFNRCGLLWIPGSASEEEAEVLLEEWFKKGKNNNDEE